MSTTQDEKQHSTTTATYSKVKTIHVKSGRGSLVTVRLPSCPGEGLDLTILYSDPKDGHYHVQGDSLVVQFL